MPGAIILGVVGGLLGSLFINVNSRMAEFRKKILVRKWMKPIETFLFCFITTTVFYWVPYYFNKCDPTRVNSGVDEQKLEMKYLGWCG